MSEKHFGEKRSSFIWNNIRTSSDMNELAEIAGRMKLTVQKKKVNV